MNRLLRFSSVGLAFAGLLASSSATVLDVSGQTRSPGDLRGNAVMAAKRFNANAADLTRSSRQLRGDTALFSLPVTVVGPPSGRSAGRAPGTFTLSFAGTGPDRFPAEYQAILEAVYSSARTSLDLVLGVPDDNRTVLVSNYNADIGDRDAVAGGIFLPDNGQGQPEILFPVYADAVGFKPEVAAVNFLHVLAMAYIRDSMPLEDPYREAMIRAATARVARIGGALPVGLDRDLIEQQLALE